ncbi:small ribosomal subunit protein uS3m [Lepeophtheirus salmonis]|uniref:28S ribosomal protein S24, mitochondrial n=1 Tax=Lepeophtheirus salmonis TaxID=72036 RepID=C1BSX1_LEPSM|nr:28S ribosomal protein S24, mitochondrial-like [Lepeophtheirus salmonis]ACO12124.1 28S ribosomal protein S24, mitochondrial precursor [Lepeophtheirus salmonis]ACO12253.1 28S ribosomal protein S24, mitochondrial precursor [Lepeophtheirus salmonis]ADD38920.1 28S ribosomal protein S24, mitochondrial [Lepeophtheirus salmonis]
MSSALRKGFSPALRRIHTSVCLRKEKAGRYKATPRRTFGLTYEMSLLPEEIAHKKSWNSLNTAQLEGTFLERESMGQDLPHKMAVEDMFIRKFMNGTWPDTFQSEIIIKRTHNLIRIAGITNYFIPAKKMYFLIGYTEEMLSLWLKCPVKLELQSASQNATIIKHI